MTPARSARQRKRRTAWRVAHRLRTDDPFAHDMDGLYRYAAFVTRLRLKEAHAIRNALTPTRRMCGKE